MRRKIVVATVAAVILLVAAVWWFWPTGKAPTSPPVVPSASVASGDAQKEQVRQEILAALKTITTDLESGDPARQAQVVVPWERQGLAGSPLLNPGEKIIFKTETLLANDVYGAIDSQIGDQVFAVRLIKLDDNKWYVLGTKLKG